MVGFMTPRTNHKSYSAENPLLLLGINQRNACVHQETFAAKTITSKKSEYWNNISKIGMLRMVSGDLKSNHVLLFIL
jgi:hypothetical protein